MPGCRGFCIDLYNKHHLDDQAVHKTKRHPTPAVWELGRNAATVLIRGTYLTFFCQHACFVVEVLTDAFPWAERTVPLKRELAHRYVETLKKAPFRPLNRTRNFSLFPKKRYVPQMRVFYGAAPLSLMFCSNSNPQNVQHVCSVVPDTACRYKRGRPSEFLGSAFAVACRGVFNCAGMIPACDIEIR